jgi:biotin carboxylase
MSLVIIEAMGTGHGLRLAETATRLEIDTVFVTSGVDRYRYDVRRALLDAPRPGLRIVSGVDTRDAGAIADVIAAHRGPDTAVLAQVDRSLLPTAQACAKLDVRSLAADVVRRCTDKAEFRAVCRAAGLAEVASHRADDVDSAVRHAARIGYPVIVKPARGTASLGVRSALDAEQVAAAAGAILAGAEGQPSAVLLEEYLVGPLVSAECFRHDGRTLLLGLTDRVLSVPPGFAELAWSFPLDLPESTVDAIRRVCVEVLDAVGFSSGPAHVELVLTVAGPRVVEVNPRLAGRGLSYIVSELSGYDEYELTIQAALGAPLPVAKPPRRTGGGAEHAVYGPAGAAVDPAAVAVVDGLPGVEYVRLVPGSSATAAFDGLVDHGEVLAWGDTVAEAQLRARAAAQFLMGQLRPHPANVREGEVPCVS